MKRWIVVAATSAVTLAAMVLLLLWLMGAFHAKVPPAAPDQVLPPAGDAPRIKVATERTPVFETAVGSVQAIHEIKIASRILARIQRMHVEKAGQTCSAGETLIELEDSELRARLETLKAAENSAQATLAKAEQDLARARQLHERGVVSDDQLEQASTLASTAQAEVNAAAQASAAAATMLDYTVIRAPIDGVIIDKQVNQGDLASPGQVLVTLYDPTRLQLVASVRERLAMQMQVGESVGVRIDALDLDCEGTISEVVPEAAAGSRSFQVKVTGPCPPGVYSGMFGRLRVQVGHRDEIRVPPAAVSSIGQIDTVFVVEDGVLLRRFVRVGARTADHVEILAGLAPGEEILADAAERR